MGKIGLIFAPPRDIHALAVAAEVQSTFKSHVAILSTARYPSEWRVDLTIESDIEPHWVVHTKDFVTTSEQVTGVWLRDFEPRHRIASEVTNRKIRQYCSDQASAALRGWLQGLGRRVINPIAAEYAALLKPYQLVVAKAVGLKTPKTLITNNPEQARHFVDSVNGSAIFKVLTNARGLGRETRQFRSKHARHLRTLRFAPTAFQELIEAQCDIRATIVDDAVFAVSIRSSESGARLDWRLDGAAEIKEHRLPQDTQQALRRLLHALGLRFGAADLRLTPEGEYVFLEINPTGQFLFCEIHGRQPISRALAASLLGMQ